METVDGISDFDCGKDCIGIIDVNQISCFIVSESELCMERTCIGTHFAGTGKHADDRRRNIPRGTHPGRIGNFPDRQTETDVIRCCRRGDCVNIATAVKGCRIRSIAVAAAFDDAFAKGSAIRSACKI